jgi:aryl-alcohol dehydrogenase-like predicted oxidoreductase
MPVNRATPEGTERYRERFADRAATDHFRRQQQLTLSSIGIGTYLGNPDTATDVSYTNAVVRAIQLGCNVIDSASNYRFQRSERSIGDALKKLSEQGFAREELVICTKGGYLPFDGAPPRNLREYVNETFVKPGIASFEDIVGGSHCMTPAYLQNQLDQSLRNMGLECVDVYYIHNPESQLGYVSEAEFYSRLKLAFEHLEQNRTEGKLAFYGVATWNGFRAAAGHHSLVRMAELAHEIGGEEHGFRFIQLPCNLAMPEATTNANETLDGERVTVVEAAKRLGVTVVASASLLQGRIDPPTAIQFVRSNPGITTALIGMSRVEHVEENLGQDFRI